MFHFYAPIRNLPHFERYIPPPQPALIAALFLSAGTRRRCNQQVFRASHNGMVRVYYRNQFILTIGLYILLHIHTYIYTYIHIYMY